MDKIKIIRKTILINNINRLFGDDLKDTRMDTM